MFNRLALGAAQFGMLYGIANQSERVTPNEAGKILDAAWSAGVRTLDTAIAYGDSEQVLGKLGIRDWIVISKLPGIPTFCSNVHEWVFSEIEKSLRRLRVESLDGLLLHRPSDLYGAHGNDLLDALLKLKNSGLVKKIGVSVYRPDELEPLFDLHKFDVVQAPCNLWDRRLVESGWADSLYSRGVEVHTRSAFLQGLLLMPASARPQKFMRWPEVWKEWDQWLDDSGLSAMQACIRYLLSIKSIHKVLVGVDNVTQFRQLENAIGGPLSSVPNLPSLDERLINPSHWSLL